MSTDSQEEPKVEERKTFLQRFADISDAYAKELVKEIPELSSACILPIWDTNLSLSNDTPLTYVCNAQKLGAPLSPQQLFALVQRLLSSLKYQTSVFDQWLQKYDEMAHNLGVTIGELNAQQQALRLEIEALKSRTGEASSPADAAAVSGPSTAESTNSPADVGPAADR